MYKDGYDDPYKVLAFSIVMSYPPTVVKRLMWDTKFLRREIAREVRGQDFRGFFIDCLFVSICEDKHRMELVRKLDDLSTFFYQQLDLGRMRAEIKNAYCALGIYDAVEDTLEFDKHKK